MTNNATRAVVITGKYAVRTSPREKCNSPHLRLQRLHLRVQFGKSLFDVAEAMYLCAEGIVAHVCQSIVDAGGVQVVEAEGVEVFRAETGYVGDVEYGGGVNKSLVDLP